MSSCTRSALRYGCGPLAASRNAQPCPWPHTRSLCIHVCGRRGGWQSPPCHAKPSRAVSAAGAERISGPSCACLMAGAYPGSLPHSQCPPRVAWVPWGRGHLAFLPGLQLSGSSTAEGRAMTALGLPLLCTGHGAWGSCWRMPGAGQVPNAVP